MTAFKRKWLAVVLGGAIALAPMAAQAAIPEFVALILYFYLMQQPQMMNNTQDVVDANLQSADAINRKRVEIWQKEVAMAMMPPPQSCASLALAKALRAADKLVPGLVNEQIARGLQNVIGASNPLEAVVQRVRRHESKYCSEADKARERCADIGALPNGDMDAGLLLDTRGYTAEQEEAAKAFLDNLTAAAPLPRLPAHLEKTPQADQLRGYLIHFGARKAVAHKVLANAYAERKRDASQGKSSQEILFEDYERRFGSQEWTDQVLRAPPGALEREKLMMETWRMQMAMRQYRQQQDLTVTIATLLDVLAEQQADQKISQLTEAAMRAKVDEN